MNSEDHPDRTHLKSHEAIHVAEVVGNLGEQGVALAEGLRAVAEESPHRPTARELQRIAVALEQGQTLEAVLDHGRAGYPRHLQGLIRAAVKTNRVGEVFGEMADHRHTMHELWRSIRIALAYPGLLLAVAACILVGLDCLVIPPFAQMFDDFGLMLPRSTQLIIELHETRLYWLGFPFLVMLVALALSRLGGRASWRRALASIPLFGSMWHWSGVCEWSRLMAVLLEQQVPLPEALRLAADGTHDANIAQISRRLAHGIEDGRSLPELLQSTDGIPATLHPLTRWGQRTGQSSEAFRAAATLYARRVRMRADLLATAFPPVIYLSVAFLVGFVALSLFMPLVSMIQGLA